MNNLDRQYISILKQILNEGYEKKNRTSVNTLSIFGTEIRHNMASGFPLLTTKKVAWKTAVKETLWFLSGSTDIRKLWKRGVSVWDGDWYKNYSENTSSPYSLKDMKEFALQKKTGFHESIWDLNKIYGHQWRHWGQKNCKNYDGIDQIQNLLDLLKNNPDSRRMIVSGWNVSDLPKMTLPPCHYSFEVWTRELSLEEIEKHRKPGRVPPERAISLKWNQRSADFPLGVPFNLVGYGAILLMLGDEMNMIPESLIGSFGDSHIYVNQVEGIKEQVGRKGFDLPHMMVEDGIYSGLADFNLTTDYLHEPSIKFPLTN